MNTESWLTTSATARYSHRSRTTVTMRERRRRAAWSHAGTGARPTIRRRSETTVPAHSPIRRANPSLRSATASKAIMTTITDTPSTAVDSTPTLAWSCSARKPSDTTGRMSLNDMFATNVMNADVATSEGVNPHDVYIA
jgi:hypothetical protein